MKSLSARSWNKLSNIIAIFNFFAYADRDLLTIVRKSVMLSLMKLFLGLPLHENKPNINLCLTDTVNQCLNHV